MQFFLRLLFFGFVTPVALVLRSIGWRGLAVGIDKNGDSYWSIRSNTGTDADSMKRQS